MSLRTRLSIITFLFIAVIVYFSRHELLHAYELLESVNLWILLLLIPGQLFVYYTAGEMVFSYLRAKKSIDHIAPPELIRMSLEMNFVNHILPSGGVSGVSYMGWRLSKYGVTPGRATMAQVVRFAMSFVAFISLLSIAVLAVTIDGSINRWIILVSSTLVTLMLGSMIGGAYLMSSRQRMASFATWLTRFANRAVRVVTFGRKRQVVTHEAIGHFFEEMHHDYIALKGDKRLLVRPFLWGIANVTAEVTLFLITFWALDVSVNPAPILIAYGVATLAGFFVVTPGGAGAYEAIMVGFLAIAGLSQGTAIAGIVLTRVILLVGTIALGYLFYQHAIIKYGKNTDSSQR